MKFIPPKLPAYLVSMFELKPDIGSPTNDEVKNVHAVIQAIDAASKRKVDSLLKYSTGS